MREATVSRSYAEALLELGERHGARAAFADGMAALSEVLESDPRVRVFLESPAVDLDTKKQVLRRALEGRVPQLFLNFVLIVLDKRRQRLLPAIAREYRALLDEAEGLVRAEVTLAHEPDERMEEEIAGELTRLLGKRVLPAVRVDPAILGGIVVRFGDRVLDGSLRRRLRGLRRRMLERKLPSETLVGDSA